MPDSAALANPQPPAGPADVTAWRRSSRRKAVRTPRRTLQAPPPAGGSIDRIASAVGRSVLFVRIFGGDHPFPFLSFPFLSFPFLSFPFLSFPPLLLTHLYRRSVRRPSQESFRRCTSGTSDPVRRTAVLTARDAGEGMFERFFFRWLSPHELFPGRRFSARPGGRTSARPSTCCAYVGRVLERYPQL